MYIYIHLYWKHKPLNKKHQKEKSTSKHDSAGAFYLFAIRERVYRQCADWIWMQFLANCWMKFERWANIKYVSKGGQTDGGPPTSFLQQNSHCVEYSLSSSHNSASLRFLVLAIRAQRMAHTKLNWNDTPSTKGQNEFIVCLRWS